MCRLHSHEADRGAVELDLAFSSRQKNEDNAPRLGRESVEACRRGKARIPIRRIREGSCVNIEVGKAIRTPLRRYDAVDSACIPVKPALGFEVVQQLPSVVSVHAEALDDDRWIDGRLLVLEQREHQARLVTAQGTGVRS